MPSLLDSFYFFFNESSQAALAVKNLLASAGDVREMESVPVLGRSPGGGQATQSSTLAWRIPWIEKPGGLRSIGFKESDAAEVT